MGVAYVDHGSFDGADGGEVDGAGHDAGDAHVGADEVVGVGGADDLAGAGASVGFEGDLGEGFGGGEPGGYAAGAVAGELGFGAVGVEEADEEGAVGAAVEELDAVGADGVGAVAEFFGEGGVVVAGDGFVEDEEVVAVGVGFDEGDEGGGWWFVQRRKVVCGHGSFAILDWWRDETQIPFGNDNQKSKNAGTWEAGGYSSSGSRKEMTWSVASAARSWARRVVWRVWLATMMKVMRSRPGMASRSTTLRRMPAASRTERMAA